MVAPSMVVGHHSTVDDPGGMMMHVRTIGTARTVPAVHSEIAGAMCALFLGVFVVVMVGFAGASVLHEAAHNTRHSIAFPCH
jgi:cobalt transporter subunit CbtB